FLELRHDRPDGHGGGGGVGGVRAGGDAAGVREIAGAGGGGVPVEGVGAGAAAAGGDRGMAGRGMVWRGIPWRGTPPPSLPRAGGAGEEPGSGLLPRAERGGGREG